MEGIFMEARKCDMRAYKNEKIFIVMTFALLCFISIFKLSYINREYFGADYSVFVLLFVPFFIYMAFENMNSISTKISFAWICVVPMSVWLYRKQFDVLITYSLAGMLAGFLSIRRERRSFVRVMSVDSAFMLLNLVAIGGIFGRFFDGAAERELAPELVREIIARAKMFGFSEASKEAFDVLNNFTARTEGKYFWAVNVMCHGIAAAVAVTALTFVLLIGVMLVAHKKEKYLTMLAALIFISQLFCHILSNTGILGYTVYEMIFCDGNRIYTLSELLLLGIMILGMFVPTKINQAR